MARYRVLLAGGDRTHQEHYAPHFMAEPRCEVVALADLPGIPEPRRAAGAAMAARLGIDFLTLDAALDRGADIACVCVPMEDRGEVAARCAGRGLHLYLDKPAAASAADARRIAAAVRAGGVQTQILSHATTPWAREARRALESGRLGTLLALHGEMLVSKGMPAELPSGIRREVTALPRFPAESAKRELFDMGYYPVSLACWLVGRPVRSVAAFTGNHFFREHLDQNAEDFGALVVEFEGGVIATMNAGRIGWDRHPWRGFMGVTLHGSGGVARFGPLRDRLVVHAPTVPFAHPAGYEHDPMSMWASTIAAIPPRGNAPVPLERESPDADISAFLDALDAGRSGEIDIEAGVRHLEIIEAAYAFAAQAQRDA